MGNCATKTIYGQTIDCECGRTHAVTPAEVIYADDALSQLPAVCAKYCQGRNVAVLMDTRTAAVAGREAAARLNRAGWDATEILVEDPAEGVSPVCDEATKNALSSWTSGADLIVPVGAGVQSDLGKWLAFEADIPFVVFGTAASMNGYASANIAIAVKGVKTLMQARPPAAVLTGPSILAECPYEMTASGLGDVLAKSVSSTDWKLNQLLFGDYYCDRSVGLIAEIEPLYIDHAADLRRGDADALEALFDACLLTGVSMTMAESSAPASGAEHLIGHSLDMMSHLDGKPHDLHGRQVGIGTVLTSELYRRVLAVESPEFGDAPTSIDRSFWGVLAGPVEEFFGEKPARLQAAKVKLGAANTWDALRAALTPMLRQPETIRDCLAAGDAAHRAEHIGCNRDRILQAFRHAHEIRDRFTVLDLAYMVGILPNAIEEIVETWA